MISTLNLPWAPYADAFFSYLQSTRILVTALIAPSKKWPKEFYEDGYDDRFSLHICLYV